MYTLKITGVTTQNDIKTLIQTLLRVPGLNSAEISRGLKFPPLNVLTVERKETIESLKEILEKSGAICEIEYAATLHKKEHIEHIAEKTITHVETNSNAFGKNFWITVILMLSFFAFITYYSGKGTSSTPVNKTQPHKKVAVQENAEKPTERKNESEESEEETKSSEDLKKDIVKNPYNPSAWKSLQENYEKEGDSVSARKAKESYDKAIKTQMVLSSLAKSFGDGTRVEITENAVHYRTNKDLDDSEFYYEAEKLREQVNEKFPNKDMILENISSKGKLQVITLKPSFTTN